MSKLRGSFWSSAIAVNSDYTISRIWRKLNTIESCTTLVLLESPRWFVTNRLICRSSLYGNLYFRFLFARLSRNSCCWASSCRSAFRVPLWPSRYQRIWRCSSPLCFAGFSRFSLCKPPLTSAAKRSLRQAKRESVSLSSRASSRFSREVPRGTRSRLHRRVVRRADTAPVESPQDKPTRRNSRLGKTSHLPYVGEAALDDILRWIEEVNPHPSMVAIPVPITFGTMPATAWCSHSEAAVLRAALTITRLKLISPLRRNTYGTSIMTYLLPLTVPVRFLPASASIFPSKSKLGVEVPSGRDLHTAFVRSSHASAFFSDAVRASFVPSSAEQFFHFRRQRTHVLAITDPVLCGTVSVLMSDGVNTARLDVVAPAYYAYAESLGARVRFLWESSDVDDAKVRDGQCYVRHVFDVALYFGRRADLSVRRALGMYPTVGALKAYLVREYGRDSLKVPMRGTYTFGSVFHCLSLNLQVDLRSIPNHHLVGGTSAHVLIGQVRVSVPGSIVKPSRSAVRRRNRRMRRDGFLGSSGSSSSAGESTRCSDCSSPRGLPSPSVLKPSLGRIPSIDRRFRFPAGTQLRVSVPRRVDDHVYVSTGSNFDELCHAVLTRMSKGTTLEIHLHSIREGKGLLGLAACFRWGSSHVFVKRGNFTARFPNSAVRYENQYAAVMMDVGTSWVPKGYVPDVYVVKRRGSRNRRFPLSHRAVDQSVPALQSSPVEVVCVSSDKPSSSQKASSPSTSSSSSFNSTRSSDWVNVGLSHRTTNKVREPRYAGHFRIGNFTFPRGTVYNTPVDERAYKRVLRLRDTTACSYLRILLARLSGYRPLSDEFFNKCVPSRFVACIEPVESGLVKVHFRSDVFRASFPFDGQPIHPATALTLEVVVSWDWMVTAFQNPLKDGYCYIRHFAEVSLSMGRIFFRRDVDLGPFPYVFEVQHRLERLYGKATLRYGVRGQYSAPRCFHCCYNDSPRPMASFIGYHKMGGEDNSLIITDTDRLRAVGSAYEKVKRNIPDSLLVRSVEKDILEFNQTLVDMHRSRPGVVVPFQMSENQQVMLTTAYPEFNINFIHSVHSDHPVAAGSRALENHLVRKHAGTDYSDVGGCPLFHLRAGHSGVHVCRPVYDVKDAHRRVVRHHQLSKVSLDQSDGVKQVGWTVNTNSVCWNSACVIMRLKRLLWCRFMTCHCENCVELWSTRELRCVICPSSRLVSCWTPVSPSSSKSSTVRWSSTLSPIGLFTASTIQRIRTLTLRYANTCVLLVWWWMVFCSLSRWFRSDVALIIIASLNRGFVRESARLNGYAIVGVIVTSLGLRFPGTPVRLVVVYLGVTICTWTPSLYVACTSTWSITALWCTRKLLSGLGITSNLASREWCSAGRLYTETNQSLYSTYMGFVRLCCPLASRVGKTRTFLDAYPLFRLKLRFSSYWGLLYPRSAATCSWVLRTLWKDASSRTSGIRLICVSWTCPTPYLRLANIQNWTFLSTYRVSVESWTVTKLDLWKTVLNRLYYVKRFKPRLSCVLREAILPKSFRVMTMTTRTVMIRVFRSLRTGGSSFGVVVLAGCELEPPLLCLGVYSGNWVGVYVWQRKCWNCYSSGWLNRFLVCSGKPLVYRPSLICCLRGSLAGFSMTLFFLRSGKYRSTCPGSSMELSRQNWGAFVIYFDCFPSYTLVVRTLSRTLVTLSGRLSRFPLRFWVRVTLNFVSFAWNYLTSGLLRFLLVIWEWKHAFQYHYLFLMCLLLFLWGALVFPSFALGFSVVSLWKWDRTFSLRKFSVNPKLLVKILSVGLCVWFCGPKRLTSFPWMRKVLFRCSGVIPGVLRIILSSLFSEDDAWVGYSKHEVSSLPIVTFCVNRLSYSLERCKEACVAFIVDSAKKILKSLTSEFNESIQNSDLTSGAKSLYGHVSSILYTSSGVINKAGSAVATVKAVGSDISGRVKRMRPRFSLSRHFDEQTSEYYSASDCSELDESLFSETPGLRGNARCRDLFRIVSRRAVACCEYVTILLNRLASRAGEYSYSYVMDTLVRLYVPTDDVVRRCRSFTFDCTDKASNFVTGFLSWRSLRSGAYSAPPGLGGGSRGLTSFSHTGGFTRVIGALGNTLSVVFDEEFFRTLLHRLRADVVVLLVEFLKNLPVCLFSIYTFNECRGRIFPLREFLWGFCRFVWDVIEGLSINTYQYLSAVAEKVYRGAFNRRFNEEDERTLRVITEAEGRIEFLRVVLAEMERFRAASNEVSTSRSSDSPSFPPTYGEIEELNDDSSDSALVIGVDNGTGRTIVDGETDSASGSDSDVSIPLDRDFEQIGRLGGNGNVDVVRLGLKFVLKLLRNLLDARSFKVLYGLLLQTVFNGGSVNKFVCRLVFSLGTCLPFELLRFACSARRLLKSLASFVYQTNLFSEVMVEHLFSVSRLLYDSRYFATVFSELERLNFYLDYYLSLPKRYLFPNSRARSCARVSGSRDSGPKEWHQSVRDHLMTYWTLLTLSRCRTSMGSRRSLMMGSRIPVVNIRVLRFRSVPSTKKFYMRYMVTAFAKKPRLCSMLPHLAGWNATLVVVKTFLFQGKLLCVVNLRVWNRRLVCAITWLPCILRLAQCLTCTLLRVTYRIRNSLTPCANSITRKKYPCTNFTGSCVPIGTSCRSQVSIESYREWIWTMMSMLLDFNRKLLVGRNGSHPFRNTLKSYCFMFCNDGLVPCPRSQKYDYAFISNQTSFVAANSFLRAVDGKDLTFTNEEHSLIVYEAPPGGGKTHSLVNSYADYCVKVSCLVVTANKNSQTEISQRISNELMGRKLAAKYVTDCSSRVFTVDSYLMNHLRLTTQLLFIDECFMVHAGAIGAVVEFTSCKAVVFFGDSKQIHYIHRNDLGVSFVADIDAFIQPEHRIYGEVSYRCPWDICEWLSEFNPRHVATANVGSIGKSSVSIEEINGCDDVPYDKAAKYIVYTQAEKNDLQKHLGRLTVGRNKVVPIVNTVHEVQGETYKRVRLVRFKYQEDTPFSSKNHIVVALSRHVDSLVYSVLTSRRYDDTATNIDRAKEIFDKFRSSNHSYGSSSLEWYLEKYPTEYKGSKASSAPISCINEFLNEVVVASSVVQLGDVSEELSSRPFQSGCDNVTVRDTAPPDSGNLHEPARVRRSKVTSNSSKKCVTARKPSVVRKS
uniref:p353 n=1 Tax=Citrus tristeza virus TaxID=12162 RepID=Q2XP16_9CLOS|nr:p353 [Citrus tristeza virus]